MHNYTISNILIKIFNQFFGVILTSTSTMKAFETFKLFFICLPGTMHIRIDCIRLAFLHCVFSNVSSNCLYRRMHNHTGCIYLTFPHYGFSNVSANCLQMRMHDHIGCICLSFLLSGSSCDFSWWTLQCMNIHTRH